MPTATATRPANADTDAASLTPGITTTEANLITAAAHRFLDRVDPGGFHDAWNVERRQDGHTVWTSPTGHTYTSTPPSYATA